MIKAKDIYRVVRRGVYNGGMREYEVDSVKVLYCGFDRDEARRVYHLHKPTELLPPTGRHGQEIAFQRIRERVAEAE